ncbi:MAG: hypothetical protein ABH832_01130 [bacterium]
MNAGKIVKNNEKMKSPDENRDWPSRIALAKEGENELSELADDQRPVPELEMCDRMIRGVRRNRPMHARKTFEKFVRHLVFGRVGRFLWLRIHYRFLCPFNLAVEIG